MLSWYKKIKSFVYRTIHSSPEVQPTALTVPFDAAVMVLIFASVVIVFAVTFDLPPEIMEVLKKAEDVIVAVFTVEYVLRLWTANLQFPEKGWFASRVRYVFSVSAIVDLLAILPSYLPYLLPEGMLGIRALRLNTPHAHLQGDAALGDALRHYQRHQGQGEGFACSIFLHVVDGAVPVAPHVRGRARRPARQVQERHLRLVVGHRDVYEVRHARVLSHYDAGPHHRRGRIRPRHLPDRHSHGHHLVRAYRANQES